MKTKPAAPVMDIKAIGDDGSFSGYVAHFGNLDTYRDIIMPGAFSKSLAEHRRKGTWPKMFWQHDTDKPIGRWTAMSEDGKGLYGEGQFNMDVQQAREAKALLKAKDIDGLSIGYREIIAEDDAEKNARRLIELSLVEASVVSLQANDRCRVDFVKAEELEEENIKWKRLMELARRFRDGEPWPPKEFEEILRDAGFPRSAAVQIASVGYAKSIRSESGGEEANPAVALALAEFRKAIDRFTIPKL